MSGRGGGGVVELKSDRPQGHQADCEQHCSTRPTPTLLSTRGQWLVCFCASMEQMQ